MDAVFVIPVALSLADLLGRVLERMFDAVHLISKGVRSVQKVRRVGWNNGEVPIVQIG
jgi:hypothetical protein